MKRGYTFRDAAKIALIPLRQIAEKYMLLDDLVWHGYDWIAKRVEEKTALERRHLTSISAISCGIGFQKAGLSAEPRLLNEQLMLLGYGFLGIPKIWDKFSSTVHAIRNEGTIDESSSFCIDFIRLGILAHSLYMMFFKDSGETPNHLFIGVVGASVASFYYLDDHIGTGIIDRMRQQAKANVAATA